MKTILIIALFCLPGMAWAGHMDVFPFTLKESCSLGTFIEIKNDFNKTWAQDYDYKAEIASPLQSDDMITIFWLGRSSNAAAFGAAYDAWNTGIQDPESVAGKLNARLSDCLDLPKGRSSYIVN